MICVPHNSLKRTYGIDTSHNFKCQSIYMNINTMINVFFFCFQIHISKFLLQLDQDFI
jgi:hypothetical protein